MNNRLFAAFLAFTGAVLFSAKAVMVKKALVIDQSVNGVNLLLLRMLIAVPFYLLIHWVYNKRSKVVQTKLSRKQYIGIALAGFAGYYLASYFDFAGLEHISAGMERVILFIFPTIVVVISAIVYKQKITVIQLVALLITYLGIFIAVKETISVTKDHNVGLGVTLIFLSAFSYACYLVGIGRMVKKIGTIRFTTYSMLVSALCISIHYLIFDRSDLWHFDVDIYHIAFWMALLSTVIPSFMLYEAIRVIGSSNAAIISGVGPVSTILLAFYFLDETMGPYQIWGTILVIIGVLVVSLMGKKENVEK